MAQADPAPIIPPLVARHAGDAAFYWSQHDASGDSPRIDLSELRRIDRLLDAHLDGVATAGEAGRALAGRELDRWQGPGDYFVCVVQALRADKPGAHLKPLWPRLEHDPARYLRGMISALAWVDPDHAWPIVAHWLKAQTHPPLQVTAWRAVNLIGPAALEHLRSSLPAALASPHAPLRAAACRCAGGLSDWDALATRLADPAREVRAEAAIALAGRHEALKAASALWRAVAEQSAELPTLGGWPRSRALHRLTRWLRHLGLIAPHGHPGIADLLALLPTRQALIFALHHGDAAQLPWIVSQAAHPESARLAGWVWSTLTGVDLQAQGLDTPGHPKADDWTPLPTDDLDPGLPEPNAEALRAYPVRLPEGTALLDGAPITPERCHELLGDRPQAVRWIAAERLRAHGIQINTRAPAQRQLSELARLGVGVP